MSKRTRSWLTFTLSGAVAYGLVFWDGFWPLGRYIAGWYVFFVVLVLFAAIGITLSVKYGPLESHTGWITYLLLW